jgi:hypothetical protein
MNPPQPPLDAVSDQWAALRCQSALTLALASDLSAAGVVGWSPATNVRYRLPRGRKTALKTVPLLPSFVFVPFAAADLAVDLGRVGRVPRNWPFLFNGDRPALPVDQLLAMNAGDRRKSGDLYKPGDKVRFVVGPFHGIVGIILMKQGRDRWLVDVNGSRLLVPGFLIRSESVSIPPS